MRIAVAADHGGFTLKSVVLDVLRELGHEPVDFGAASFQRDDDYPDFAEAVASAMQRGEVDRGVIVCGSGVGVSVAANKFEGVRAAVCHDTYSAHQGVEHDNMNVLCMGARIIGCELAADIVRAFAGATFSNAERHRRRLDKVLEFERRSMHAKEATQ